ncbi:Uncharacterised protein [Mycobacteroides abscessus subsp. abscessus]|nr:Uncharacterised protein [Mycobacteroides abscessus subsp. abscessus]
MRVLGAPHEAATGGAVEPCPQVRGILGHHHAAARPSRSGRHPDIRFPGRDHDDQSFDAGVWGVPVREFGESRDVAGDSVERVGGRFVGGDRVAVVAGQPPPTVRAHREHAVPGVRCGAADLHDQGEAWREDDQVAAVAVEPAVQPVAGDGQTHDDELSGPGAHPVEHELPGRRDRRVVVDDQHRGRPPSPSHYRPVNGMRSRIARFAERHCSSGGLATQGQSPGGAAATDPAIRAPAAAISWHTVRRCNTIGAQCVSL